MTGNKILEIEQKKVGEKLKITYYTEIDKTSRTTK